jgi:diamine N-acetyltransferase
MTVRIRRGVDGDAPSLAELAAITFPLATPQSSEATAVVSFIRDVLSAERFTGYLADPTRIVLVAEADGALVGYAMLVAGDPDDPEVAAAVTTRPTIDLNKFYVHPDCHGSGAASTLMTGAIDAARAAGARAMWLGVNNENDRANRFYEKHGFAVVGTKHFLLGDRLEDDFVRERVL